MALSYEGCNFLRQRLVLATLSSRPVKISKIRSDTDEPGLKEFEAGFIRLLDKLTNGSRIEVNETGTTLLYKPGVLVGGTLEHDCSLQRSIGYFLEPLVLMAPFAKKPLKITLRGNTNSSNDPSVDYYRVCVVPLLKKFLPDNNLHLKIVQRGVWPGGGGEVEFSCPVVRRMKPIQMVDCGKVRRVRGVAYCLRVSPSMANRMVDSARSVLNSYLPDVYIYTDVARGGGKERSPGYGITLVSESTTAVLHAAELSSQSRVSGGVEQPHPLDGVGQREGSSHPPALPEELGKQTALLLIQEIVKGGYVDSGSQIIALLFMAMGQRDVSKVELGELTPYTIQFLRHMRDFFQLVYKLEVREEEMEEDITRQLVTLSCVGVGFSNYSKGIM